jgi:hypothetical protein
MSYTIYFSDPAKFSYPITVSDNTIFNGVGTGGLTLVGRNYPGYGQYVADSFIKVLENFASPTPPANPVEGQLWYDNDTKKLRINDGAANNANWKPVNGIFQQDLEPTDVIVGDIWVDTTTQQMRIWTGSTFRLIGPAEEGVSETGSVPGTITDIYDVDHKVIQQIVDGVVVEIITTEAFTPKVSIFGFSVLDAGINLSQTSLMNGTALNAQYLVQNGSAIAGNSFMRKDTSQTLSGQLTLNQDANALRLGTAASVTLGVSSNGSIATFSNNYTGFYGSYSFNTKDNNGATVELFNIGGSTLSARIPSNTQATSTVTGALQVVGGVGIGGNLYIGGTLAFPKSTSILSVGSVSLTTSTNSTSTTTGALVTPGGIGIGGNLYIGGNISIPKKLYDSFGNTGTSGQILVSRGTYVQWTDVRNTSATSFASTLTVTGLLKTEDPTNAISTVTGALQVVGGVGIGRDLWVGGKITAQELNIQYTTVTTTVIFTDDIIRTSNITPSTSVNSGALVIGGGAGIGLNLNVGGNLNVATNAAIVGSFTATNSTVTSLLVNSTVNATSTLSGAVIIRGGLGVGRDLYARNMFTNGHAVSTQTYALNTATTSTLGGVRIGNTMLIDGNAVINFNTNTAVTTATYATYALTTATVGSLGVVIIGNGIDINYQGVISLNTSTLMTTATTAQFVSTPATSVSLGGVRVGTGIGVTANGTISITTSTLMAQAVNITTVATSSAIGAVKVDGTSITVNGAGTISATPYSLPIATTSTRGGVIVNTVEPSILVEEFFGTIDVNPEFISRKKYNGYNVSYNTTASWVNIDARITTGGVAQLKASQLPATVAWTSQQMISSTSSVGITVNTGTSLSTSTWTAVGNPNPLATLGDTIVTTVQDTSYGIVYRIMFMKTATANSGTVIIEQLI